MHATMPPIVSTHAGCLKGKKAKDRNGGTYFSFQGIPYAKPPLGPLRFKAPEPAEPWTSILDATREPPACYSHHITDAKIVGVENCLFLNVYTPSLPNSKKHELKPVMFYIHGGRFLQGSSRSDFYGPEFLITEDVVVVTFNYRLGLLGFLTLEDESLGVPGNAGFKDMVMALKWVKSNIQFFMGDPENITIFGSEAGGAAVHLLCLSPMAKGLFHKAIIHSGCALNTWVLSKSCSKEVAENLNILYTTDKALLNALQRISVHELLVIQDMLTDNFIVANEKPFIGAVIEKGLKEPGFLTKDPIEIIESGDYLKIPIIIGYTSMEGMAFDIYMEDAFADERFPNNYETFVPNYLDVAKGSELSKEIAERIKRFYVGRGELSRELVQKDYLMRTDVYFFRGIYATIKNYLLRGYEDIYLYRFSAETKLNIRKQFTKTNVQGACNGDDIFYLFKSTYTPVIEFNSTEDIAIKTMVKLWSSFAHNGNPNVIQKHPFVQRQVQWKPVTYKQVWFLDIGKDLTMMSDPEPDRMNFWDDIYLFAISNKCNNKALRSIR